MSHKARIDQEKEDIADKKRPQRARMQSIMSNSIENSPQLTEMDTRHLALTTTLKIMYNSNKHYHYLYSCQTFLQHLELLNVS